MITTLIFDVDNTITESCQVISDEMAQILNNLKQEIVFVSGTSFSELKRMISLKLKRRHHILANTGTHYVIMDNQEKEILSEKLSDKQKKEIISALKKLKEEFNLLPLTTESDQIQDRNSQITFSVLGRNAPSDKKYSFDPSKEKRKNYISYLENILSKKIYQMTIGGTTSIDITLAGKDKASAIRMLMDKNNLFEKEILFFGDQLKPGGNDFPVIITGIKCVEVNSPKDTLQKLKSLLE